MSDSSSSTSSTSATPAAAPAAASSSVSNGGVKRVGRVVKPAGVSVNASPASARAGKPTNNIIAHSSSGAEETKRAVKPGIRTSRPASAAAAKRADGNADSKTAAQTNGANHTAAPSSSTDSSSSSSSSSSSASFSRPTTSSRRHTAAPSAPADSAPFTGLITGPQRPTRVPWSTLRKPQIQRQAQESHLDGVLSAQKDTNDSTAAPTVQTPARDDSAFTLFQYDEAKPDRHLKLSASVKGGITMKPKDREGILHWQEDKAASQAENGKSTAKKHYESQSGNPLADAPANKKNRPVPQVPGNYSNMSGILPTPPAIVSPLAKDEVKSSAAASAPKTTKVKQVGGASSITFSPDSTSAAGKSTQSLRATGKGSQSNNIFTPDTGPLHTGRALISSKRTNESNAFRGDQTDLSALSPRTAKAVNAQKNASHLQPTGSGTGSFLSTDAPQPEQKRIPRRNVANTSSVFSHYTDSAKSASAASSASPSTVVSPRSVGITSSKALQRPVVANSNGNILTWK